jgi:hypothetical protein
MLLDLDIGGKEEGPLFCGIILYSKRTRIARTRAINSFDQPSIDRSCLQTSPTSNWRRHPIRTVDPSPLQPPTNQSINQSINQFTSHQPVETQRFRP